MDITKILGGTGQGFNLYAILVQNHCLIQEFVDSLDDAYKKQVLNLFHQIITIGLPKNEERFRPIGDQIYELKTRRGVRLLCFFAGQNLPRSLILTHGFFKPQRKIFVREKKKAVAWREEYEGGEINIVP